MATHPSGDLSMVFDPTLNLANAVMIVGMAIAGLTVWYNTRNQVQKNTERIKEVSDMLSVANAKVALALERADDIRTRSERELAEYKLTVAKEYATVHSIREVEERVVQAIERLGDRLDKFLDTSRAQPRSPPRN